MSSQKPSFEQAISASILWCNSWESGEISDEVLADRVKDLLETIEGARGFFAISLSSENALMDRLPLPLIIQLRKSGKIVVDLLVKNLAMSSAMAITHYRNKKEDQKDSSERIISRCQEVLRLMEPKLVKERLENLIEGTNGKGEYENFIKRWGYDQEQKKAIKESALGVAQY